MGELLRETNDISINANILTKKEDGLFVAHCLEFDIVATGDTAEQAQRECVALICAQIEYAFIHDNLDNLYHSAPSEVWAEFFKCKAQVERRYKIEKRFDDSSEQSFIPPWLIAKTCQACHV
ncbi:MAG: hypothetical protein V1753_03265 [Pseudomonadota bacterium]